jgi:hypothetical protein
VRARACKRATSVHALGYTGRGAPEEHAVRAQEGDYQADALHVPYGQNGTGDTRRAGFPCIA